MKNLSAVILLVIISNFFSFAQETEESSQSIVIEEFLHAGGFYVTMPAFADQENADGELFEEKDLLKQQYFNPKNFRLRNQSEIAWRSGEKLTCTKIPANDTGLLIIPNGGSDDYALHYFAFYVASGKYRKTELEVYSGQILEVFMNNVKLGGKYSKNKKDKDTGKFSKAVGLEPGKHYFVIKLLSAASDSMDVTLKVQLRNKTENGDISISLDEKRCMRISDLLEGRFISSADISPDGEFYMLRFNEIDKNGDRSSFVEIRDSKDDLLFHSFPENTIGSPRWMPQGNRLSYSKEGVIYVYDLDMGKVYPVSPKIDKLYSYTWSDDASFIIYLVRKKIDKDADLKRYQGMPDRWPWWKNRYFLYMLDVRSGVSQCLTHGFLTTSLQDIHPDGSHILFSQSVPDFRQLPYSKQIVFEMDLKNISVDTIAELQWSASWEYYDKGSKFLVVGGPSAFGKTGENVQGDKTPNNYDRQLYSYDRKTNKVKSLTKDFHPSVLDVKTSENGSIYLLAQEGTYQNVYHYAIGKNEFARINTGMDVVSEMSLDKKGAQATFRGSSISTPGYAVLYDMKKESSRVIATPEKKKYRDVRFGKTAEWNFNNKDGVSIKGRVYFPPGFNPGNKYPLIVYYYGGTNPTSRSFGGRYPKNLFAAQGYVVYVLQPSGATGFGQDFSAMHVNNWGKTVADEIIQGTTEFIMDHAFIDADKVGCIGASYGGFMTMYLLTQTEIFAAGISHAGISSISSYWGEGYWGYLYSAVASANSFPWNNKDLYVEQSPLFNADKINTPLLLLHGSEDTNVPPGESIQLYTALKLLGKEVEYVEVKGQNHHITDFKKRIAWQKTIFAWYEKWLKDDATWWEELYPEGNY